MAFTMTMSDCHVMPSFHKRNCWMYILYGSWVLIGYRSGLGESEGLTHRLLSGHRRSSSSWRQQPVALAEGKRRQLWPQEQKSILCWSISRMMYRLLFIVRLALCINGKWGFSFACTMYVSLYSNNPRWHLFEAPDTTILYIYGTTVNTPSACNCNEHCKNCIKLYEVKCYIWHL